MWLWLLSPGPGDERRPASPEQEGVEEKQQADEMGPDGVLYDPATSSSHAPNRASLSQEWLFLSWLPWLRLRELSEAQGRDKGLVIPQDCSCWLGSQGSPHYHQPPTVRNLTRVTCIPRP